MGNLSGKVALVTGARRGIGRGIGLELAREGADVAINDVENAAQAEAVAEEIRALGCRALVVMADVTQPDQVTAMIDQVVQRLGRLGYFGQQRGGRVDYPVAGYHLGGMGSGDAD